MGILLERLSSPWMASRRPTRDLIGLGIVLSVAIGCPGCSDRGERVGPTRVDATGQTEPPPPSDPEAVALVERAATCPFDQGLQSFSACPEMDALRAHARATRDDPAGRRAMADTLLGLVDHPDPRHRQAATSVLELKSTSDPRLAATQLVAALEREADPAVASEIGRRFRGLDIVALNVSDRILGVATSTTHTRVVNALLGPLGHVADRCPQCDTFLRRTAREHADVTTRGAATRALAGGRPSLEGCATLAELCDTEKESPVVPFLAFSKTGDTCKDQIGAVISAFEHRVDAKERIDNHLVGVRAMVKRGMLEGPDAIRMATVLRKARKDQRATIVARIDALVDRLDPPSAGRAAGKVPAEDPS